MNLKNFLFTGILPLLILITSCPSPEEPPLPEPVIPQISLEETTLTIYTPRLYLNANGTDDGAITGWKITATAGQPDPGSSGWQAEKPWYDLPEPGNYTLYLWARDNDNLLSRGLELAVEYVSGLTRDWTIMVWMDGDNDLEPQALLDIHEMEEGLALAAQRDGNLDSKLAVVVQLDRVAYYDTASHDEGSDWTGSRRYLVKPDLTAGDSQLTSRLILDQGEINMGDAAELAGFITYTKTWFPANHYALILWNHGQGVRNTSGRTAISRYISVDFSSEYDALYTGELTDILDETHAVDVLGIDACLMGMVEIGYEYRPEAGKFGADYYVASPAREQTAGWAYNRILGRLAAGGNGGIDPGALTPDSLASLIVEEYSNFIELETLFYNSETMTALDLGQIAGVKTSLDALAVKISEQQTAIEALRGFGEVPVTLEYFTETEFYADSEGDADTVNDREWANNPHFDLYDLATRINGEAGFSSDIRDAAVALMTAVDNCVLTSYAGSDYAESVYGDPLSGNPVDGLHGLGLFFPDGNRFYETYGMYHYQLQWYYTDYDTAAWQPPPESDSKLYGKIDFCNSDSDGIVETWRELLEYWYDRDMLGDWTYYTPGTY